MNQIVEKKWFRGVVCVRCRQPIPVPSVVGRKRTEGLGTGVDAAQEMTSRVFTLRCRACQSEHPYMVTQIVDCEDVTGPYRPVQSSSSPLPTGGESAKRAASA